MQKKCRSIAIYLPQFHPIPENDVWWGKGFTEWTNVTRAKPLFRNHVQPNLPADLGFYDLRLQESRIEQEQLAKDYGIYGFCYYHYWFEGKRLLHQPLDLKLITPSQDLPFMLCWANETWSKRWLGEEKNILIKQTYSDNDTRNHAYWLYKYVFSDSRYIRVNGRPVFVIYRPHEIADVNIFISIFKSVASDFNDASPYFIASNSHTNNTTLFDNVLNFEPQLSLLPNAFNENRSFKKLITNLFQGVFSSKLKVYDYSYVKRIMANKLITDKYIPCIFVGWDNSPRRDKNGIIIINKNPNVFKASLINAKNNVLNNPEDERFVFINAWNEWAEGNYLEPDSIHGLDFLRQVKEVFNEA